MVCVVMIGNERPLVIYLPLQTFESRNGILQY